MIGLSQIFFEDPQCPWDTFEDYRNHNPSLTEASCGFGWVLFPSFPLLCFQLRPVLPPADYHPHPCLYPDPSLYTVFYKIQFYKQVENKKFKFLFEKDEMPQLKRDLSDGDFIRLENEDICFETEEIICQPEQLKIQFQPVFPWKIQIEEMSLLLLGKMEIQDDLLEQHFKPSLERSISELSLQ